MRTKPTREELIETEAREIARESIQQTLERERTKFFSKEELETLVEYFTKHPSTLEAATARVDAKAEAFSKGLGLLGIKQTEPLDIEIN